MFNNARLKLTAWYLLIIMLISISFSLVIYRFLDNELSRAIRSQMQRQRVMQIPLQLEDNFPRTYIVQAPNPQVIQEAEERLKLILFGVNIAILILSGGAGYFLAGRTLKPIQEMMDEQNRFITDSSHELRTPLTSLKSEIEVGLRDKNLNLKEAKQLLESNLEEVNNLQYLSDNLIKLTQNKTNNGINFELISLIDVIDESIKKVSKMAKLKNINIKKQIKNEQLMGDKQSVVELFVILLDNAIKYSDEGKDIDLTSEKLDKFLQIKIKDQGIGIDKKDLPHLFDRFYRADKSRTKKDTPGYGLGLSIAKQIVEKHQGSIKVESEPGEGSVFIISVPA